MSIQQVQAAHYLVRILEEILAKDETLTPADRTNYQEMKEKYKEKSGFKGRFLRENYGRKNESFFLI